MDARLFENQECGIAAMDAKLLKARNVDKFLRREENV